MINTITIRYADDTFAYDYTDETEVEDGVRLEQIFAEWNGGSYKECEAFLANRQIRSLSVADFVKINDQWYQCASFGWNEVSDDYFDKWLEAIVNERKLYDKTYSFEDERMIKFLVSRNVKQRFGY